jgi:hypothetical protein
MICQGQVIAFWLLANLLLVGVYDVYAYFNLSYDASVSYWCQKWFMAWPVLSMLVGIVLGHLAWPLNRGLTGGGS